MLNKLKNLALVLAVAASAQVAHAAPVTLNFDAFADGTLLNTAYSGLGVNFNPTARVVLGGGGVVSQPNFATGGDGFASNLEVIFDDYGLSIGASNVTSSVWVLTAYDDASNVIGSINSGGFGVASVLQGIGNIKRAVFSTSSQYGIDNLTFDAVVSRDVPEPGSLALLSLSLLALAGASRRRAKQ